jgi:hypothetical protein
MWGVKMFGKPKFLRDLERSIERNAALAFAPIDEELWAKAERAKQHISPKAVVDEYEILMHQKLDSQRGFWSRLFSR